MPKRSYYLDADLKMRQVLAAVVERLEEALTSRGLEDEGEGRQQVGLPAPVPEFKELQEAVNC